jgi:hypothetical protein
MKTWVTGPVESGEGMPEVAKRMERVMGMRKEGMALMGNDR